jgi:Zn-dependent M28 family amino/carboxypeptidase
MRKCLASLALVASTFLQPLLAQPAAEHLRAHTVTLSSNEFEGRSPGTAGEEKTVRYLIEQFQQYGLEPGNPNGTYVQDVPLVGITSKTKLSFQAGGQTLEPTPAFEYVANSRRVQDRIAASGSDIVFVGYGVVAPEYDWDDFKDVDVRGKTVVMLINDPPVTRPDGKLDETIFRGAAMTYYGRWTYKYEIASAKGAAACVIIHETGPAGYPFAVVGSGAGREGFDLSAPGGNADRVGLEGWMTWDFSHQLFAAAGQDLAKLKAAAARRDFRPVPLEAKLDFVVENTIRDVASKNVVALLPGRDPQRRNEYLVYTAHWDHLGVDERLEGDQIFNGAMDNATGTAILLELARNFAALPDEKRPARSMIFLAVTAEEKGLLGSRFYAENPLYPLRQTIANINMDGANIYAPTRDIEVVGSGSTTIEDVAARVAARHGRVTQPDTQPEKGFFYRSDHFEFAKVGVPAFYPKAGREPLNREPEYIDRMRTEFTNLHYHKPSDEVQPHWDFEAVAQDARFVFEVGLELAQQREWPQWLPGSEFKSRRDAMLQQ